MADNYAGRFQGNPIENSGASGIHRMKHGDVIGLGRVAGNNPAVLVKYESSPSYGDNGKKVPGATTGRYTINYPGGRQTVHEHGPNANTPTAAKRGANPNAKALTAYRVHDEVTAHLHREQMASAQIGRDGAFNDRRPAGSSDDGHKARLDDDSPQSKAKCKDCGKRITWNGPNHSDWAHV